MAAPQLKLSLPITCECGHGFTIDPVGVQPWTDIHCPKCDKIDHVSQEALDEVEGQLMDALGDLYEDEDDYQNAIAFWYDAQDKQRAIVVDDGL